MKKGVFITFEGADGSGKTTQIAKTAEWFKSLGYEVVCTREPGGTPAAEKIRNLVLDANLKIAHQTETLLYLAARADHMAQLIKPSLEAGKIVLCDRFSDSTFVYQGCGRGVPLASLKMLDSFATGALVPALTVLLDGDPEALLARRIKRAVSDKFELEGIAFQQKIRAAFLALAEQEPERIFVVDALQEEAAVTAAILARLSKVF
ncbi:MAG TPA: dTMP kinase [Candidatus Avacidaminococcus intestinavium]|uniref:Thymidylate kinase n=1 Tax=Candidatus Avacidaminococcus intestinavium TaxID=2840684 RepID=A0A9D1SLH7_9FIRM|nr:dTMP kinase [Candidatus Avacidaminococcus intestinavium]